MIKIFDEEKIPCDRKYNGEDDLSDIDPDLIVDDLVVENMTPFIYDGYIYSPCIVSLKHPTAICTKTLIKPKNNMIDYTLTAEITCPYCGNKFTDSWEMADDDEVVCDYCHSKYAYVREIEVSYSSDKIEKAELKEIISSE